MTTRYEGMKARLLPANRNKVGRRAGETIQITSARGQPGRPSNRGHGAQALQRAEEAVLKSKQSAIRKSEARRRKEQAKYRIVKAAMGGQTPITEKGLRDRPTLPILPPGYRG